MISHAEAQALRYIARQKGKCTLQKLRRWIADADLITDRARDLALIEIAGDQVMLTESGKREIQDGA